MELVCVYPAEYGSYSTSTYYVDGLVNRISWGNWKHTRYVEVAWLDWVMLSLALIYNWFMLIRNVRSGIHDIKVKIAGYKYEPDVCYLRTCLVSYRWISQTDAILSSPRLHKPVTLISDTTKGCDKDKLDICTISLQFGGLDPIMHPVAHVSFTDLNDIFWILVKCYCSFAVLEKKNWWRTPRWPEPQL
jgi:hypothetical protein